MRGGDTEIASSHVLRHLGLVLSLALPSTQIACALSAATNESEYVEPRPVAICFAGRTVGSDPMKTGGIEAIAGLCEVLPGLVRDSRDGEHYPFFRWNSPIARAADRVFEAMDTDRNGIVDAADAPAALTVVGYSWGGFNARDLAAALRTDTRFSPERRTVAKLFTVDPYRVFGLGSKPRWLDVPSNVRDFYEFRHTVAPERECSRLLGGLVGPFTGVPPRCSGATACVDYDYSLAPNTTWVDHCAVPSEAKTAILRLALGAPVEGLPPTHTVERY